MGYGNKQGLINTGPFFDLMRLWKLIKLLVFLALLGQACISAEGTGVFSPPEEVTSPEIIGYQQSPMPVEFQGKLHLFWSGNTPENTNDHDFDIIHANYDGERWSDSEELTPNDSGNDYNPFPIVYQDTLFLFWSSDDSTITDGSDNDLVVSTYDGQVWSDPKDLTTQQFNDYGDYNPYPIVYNNNLYVFFELYIEEDDRLEIGFVRHNGTSWGGKNSITINSQGNNINPCCAVSEKNLIVAWESYDRRWTGSTTNSSIIARVFNGTEWGQMNLISGKQGNNRWPTICALDGKFFLFWSSTCQQFTDGKDSDVVMRKWEDGNWNDFVIEFTTNDQGDDNSLFSYSDGNKLYLSWISNNSLLTHGEDTDIVIRSYDGSKWSQIYKVGPEEEDIPDGGSVFQDTPGLANYKGKLWIFWEANANPDISNPSQNTWLMMSTFQEKEDEGLSGWSTLTTALIIVLALFILWGLIKIRLG